MKIWAKPLLASLIAASLTLSYTPEADGAQGDTLENDVGQNDAGMCRRAPSPIVLADEPPETFQPRGRSAAPDRSAPLLPPPPPPPPPSDSSAAEGAVGEVLITGALIAGAAAVGVPVTTVGEAEFGETPAGSAFEYRERAAQPPPAGLLTAGDYDDLLNPVLYARYVDSFLESESLQGVPRVDTARVLAVDIQDRAGRPVPFAPVTLTCADGNQLTLTTIADGSAIFFPELDILP